MTAHRVQTVVREDGKVAVDDLPLRAGCEVEVIILVKEAVPAASANRYPLRGKPFRFDDPESPAIPEEDWDANR